MEVIDQTRLTITTVDVVDADGRWRQARKFHTRMGHVDMQKETIGGFGIENNNVRT